MYQVDICYFNEGKDGREWGEFFPLVWDMSYMEANEYAKNYAGMRLNLAHSLACKNYDGCSIDIRKMADPLPHAYVAGYEFVPDQPLEAWISDSVAVSY
jgi:hypothetical protein